MKAEITTLGTDEVLGVDLTPENDVERRVTNRFFTGGAKVTSIHGVGVLRITFLDIVTMQEREDALHNQAEVLAREKEERRIIVSLSTATDPNAVHCNVCGRTLLADELYYVEQGRPERICIKCRTEDKNCRSIPDGKLFAHYNTATDRRERDVLMKKK